MFIKVIDFLSHVSSNWSRSLKKCPFALETQYEKHSLVLRLKISIIWLAVNFTWCHATLFISKALCENIINLKLLNTVKCVLWTGTCIDSKVWLIKLYLEAGKDNQLKQFSENDKSQMYQEDKIVGWECLPRKCYTNISVGSLLKEYLQRNKVNQSTAMSSETISCSALSFRVPGAFIHSQPLK